MNSARDSFDQRLAGLKRRLVREAASAIAMLEGALAALWTLDVEAARAVRRRDDSIDLEEVEIEQECYRMMTLENPVARDFRVLAFILRVNADIERVGDHASSIAKLAGRFSDPTSTPSWPTALRELGVRVPLICQNLLRAVLAEDVPAAREIVESDKVIDRLDRELFSEVAALLELSDVPPADGLLMYRLGRELERIGDLMSGIAEDLVYLVTGEIIRHAKKRARLAEVRPEPPSDQR
ncbi:MAG: phosphate signaling complex protein PhoU [Phycisphaerales bacterium]|nr:phosphate signaling complex protein PhoU [Phycisphaerales bacterium]